MKNKKNIKNNISRYKNENINTFNSVKEISDHLKKRN